MELFSPNTVMAFVLVLARVTGMLGFSPFFSQKGVPSQVHIAVAMTISFILFPIYALHANLHINNMWQLTWLLAQEFVLGALIGFTAQLVFSAVDMAGSHISMQCGLSAANALDPIDNTQAPVLGMFYQLFALVLFMTLNLHHTLILAVAKSFEWIPVASGFANISLLANRITTLSGDIYPLSIMLVLPVFGILLVLEVALAFMSKLMPSMNIFMVAMPLKILTGLTLMLMTFPFTIQVLIQTFSLLQRHLMMLYQPA